MNNTILNENEMQQCRNIFEDLEYLFSQEIISLDEPDKVLENLKSEELRRYINHIAQGSKKETALREDLLAGGSLLSKYLFGHLIPEVSVGEGFVDYLIRLPGKKYITLELKPLFEAEVEGQNLAQS
ncbi:MAG: hypothetical protein B5M53_03700 [Candidatus Cloacimonas sp. 4484_209]|nr:MAG: hypothetical protein B5M53_03700 [Candidatus Cloacimonas sp. 4484_209]